MPYIKDGKKYSRMTELLGYSECEALAWIEETYGMDRPKRGTLAAITGTVSHHKFAEYEMKQLEKPYKQLKLNLNPDERIMLRQLLLNRKKQTQIQNNSKERFHHVPSQHQITQYELFNQDINNAYANFLAFCADHPHKTIYVEEKRFWDTFQVAGTVDLIASFKIKGVLREKEVPFAEPAVRRTYFFEEPLNPVAKEYEVATILDWKTSKVKQAGHLHQLSGYHFMWEGLGEFEKLRNAGYVINNEAYSVLLGERKKISQREQKLFNGNPPPYQFIKYPTDYTHFLLSLGVKKDPRPLTAGIDGKTGLKGKCMICSDVYYCPDNINIPVVSNKETYIPLMPFNLKEVSHMKMLLTGIVGKTFDPIKKKVERMYDELIEISDIHDSSIYEILENIGIDTSSLDPSTSTQFLSDLLEADKDNVVVGKLHKIQE